MNKQLQLLVALFLCLAIAVPAMGDGDGAMAKALGSGPTVKTTERVNRDNSGQVTRIHTTKESSVTIVQKLDEIKQRDKHGAMTLASATRTTQINDAHGGNTTITETIPRGESDLKITKIVKVKITPSGTITTIQERDGAGSLSVSRRTTVEKAKDGTVTTTVETPDASGEMVMTHTTKSY